MAIFRAPVARFTMLKDSILQEKSLEMVKSCNRNQPMAARNRQTEDFFELWA